MMMYRHEKGFYKKDFLEWLFAEFPGIGADPWTRELIENVIAFGQKHEHISKDQFAYWIFDMLPDVEFLEAARFMDPGCLTDATIEALRAQEKEVKTA